MNNTTKEMVDALARALSESFQQYSDDTGIPLHLVINDFNKGLRIGPEVEINE